MIGSKFKCPKCGGFTRITDSRCRTPSTTNRRRECVKCNHRVSTIERIFEERFFPKVEKIKNRPPLYLFTSSAYKDFIRIIEAIDRKEAEEIAVEKGWTKMFNWNIKYIGWPARKEWAL